MYVPDMLPYTVSVYFIYSLFSVDIQLIKIVIIKIAL